MSVFFVVVFFANSTALILASSLCSWLLFVHIQVCNEVSRYGKKEAGTGEHSTHFNNKINKHK